MDQTAPDSVPDIAAAPRRSDRLKLLTIANLAVLGAVVVAGSFAFLSKPRSMQTRRTARWWCAT